MIGTHHDSITLESPLEKVDDHKKCLDQIMRETSKRFIGNEIRVKPHVYEGRFEEDDEDAVKDWGRISELLKKYE
jgi:hypothetical protein